MRHRRQGRKLGRKPPHQRALLRSLASALFLTERDAEGEINKPPKVKGRIITTIEKAKEVRPLVERCITIARRALPHQNAADELEPNAERNSEQWRAWRHSDRWQQWNKEIAPVVAARRRALRLLGDKQAVRILFDDIAPRYADRNGGYTRVLRLAKPRLGDAGTRAILEFVGKNDRVRREAARPAFDTDVTEPAAAAPATDEATDAAKEQE
jgi:large subunit ribosomal protein L17